MKYPWINAWIWNRGTDSCLFPQDSQPHIVSRPWMLSSQRSAVRCAYGLDVDLNFMLDPPIEFQSIRQC